MRGLVEFHQVSKIYDGTLALADFSHAFAPGRVHALMGRNGSGKSTAIKILAGAVQLTEGELHVNGNHVVFAQPADAFAAGIVTVHQELSIIPSLSVGENIFLGRLPRRKGFGAVIDWSRLYREAATMLQEVELDIDPRQPASRLSLGQQQMVEIVKAMSFSPSILILDEPTSSLASLEVAHLFALVRRLKSRGVTVIYITHRMNELFEIADTCTVLRDGRYVGSIEMAQAAPDAIVEMMFGDVAKAVRPPRRRIVRDKPVLSVRSLTRASAFTDVSFDLYPGEVLGMAGLLGAGRTEVLRAVFGADRYDGGQITLEGRAVAHANPRRMKALGLGYTPENRKEVGLVQIASVHDNLIMASLRRVSHGGFTTREIEAPYVSNQVRDLAIKVADPSQIVSSLSGGNQQKVVIGNWLNTKPKVMFFDEPSRGVDMQAKQQIFEIMWKQADAGLSSVFVSSELEELLDVCDRILVMHQGRVVRSVEPADTTLTELYRMCMEGR
jgi:ABC-type sugar transport system ATPase subunit